VVLLALPDDGGTARRHSGRTPRPAVNTEAIRQIDGILVRRAA